MKKIQFKTIIALALILVLSISMAAYAAPDEPAGSPAQSAGPQATPAGSTGLQASQSAEPQETQSAEPTPEGTFFSEENIPSEKGITLYTLEELQRIGQDEAYPLDGDYVLANNIDGVGAAFAAIGSADAPFVGTLNGGGHTVANLAVSGGGLFANFQGKLHSLELRDITVNAEEKAGVLAGIVSGEAEIMDVFITGSIGKRADGTDGVSGGLAGSVQSAAKLQNVQAYVANPNDGKLDGALAGSNSAEAGVYSGCVWSGAYANFAFGVDSAVSEAEGAYRIQTAPTYLALMTGETGSLAANTNTENYGLAFKGFETTDESIVTIGQDGSATAGETVAAADVISVYTHAFADRSTGEVRFTTPAIVSQNINEPLPLEPVDPIFPTQIEQVQPLQPIDHIFPTQLEQEEQTVIEISTWEQFKNIGNTEYDPAYTLDADYALAADVTADAEPFTPIGTKEAPFRGTFDGRTYTIDVAQNESIDTNAEYNGLFGVVQPKE